jgi:hypothetical protein
MGPFGPRRPLRARRGITFRVLLRPRLAARLLAALADDADVNRVAVGVVLRACACAHVSRGGRILP